MLMQRIVLRSCHRQILEPSRNLRNHGSKPFDPPHAPPMSAQLQQRLLRAFRHSARPERTPTNLQATILPFQSPALTGGSVPRGKIIKAIIFTGAFSVGSFLGATVMEYENARTMMMQKGKRTKAAWFARKQTSDVESNWTRWKRNVQQFWDQLTPGEKIFVPLCALNLLVFGLWRVPRLRPTMMTYFASNPAARVVCWPMILSTFSHYSTFHIFANMYVLHSFSNAAVMSLGKEQFLAVYLSAGVISSLTSILYKAVTAQAGFSLGASGAIMAILAYVCAQYPETQLSILFLPMFTFSAGAAIKVIMGIDLVGCIMGWKIFDHAAHLGGALFGIFWASYGMNVWQQRIPFLTAYHDIRKTK